MWYFNMQAPERIEKLPVININHQNPVVFHIVES